MGAQPSPLGRLEPTTQLALSNDQSGHWHPVQHREVRAHGHYAAVRRITPFQGRANGDSRRHGMDGSGLQRRSTVRPQGRGLRSELHPADRLKRGWDPSFVPEAGDVCDSDCKALRAVMRQFGGEPWKWPLVNVSNKLSLEADATHPSVPLIYPDFDLERRRPKHPSSRADFPADPNAGMIVKAIHSDFHDVALSSSGSLAG